MPLFCSISTILFTSLLVFIIVVASSSSAAARTENDFFIFQSSDEESSSSSSSQQQKTKRHMSSTTRGNADLIKHLIREGNIRSELVQRIFANIDRRWFVPQHEQAYAYADRPLPTTAGQTISAPHMHAMQLELISHHLKPGGRALDVGSGTGIMLAMFSEILGASGKSVGIEYVPPVFEFGQQCLQNAPKPISDLVASGAIVNKLGDGWRGVPEFAPYDAIHVGAAASEIPRALLQQLAPGGRMVIPVGPDGGHQELMVVDKDKDGNVTSRAAMGVMFVPLVKGS